MTCCQRVIVVVPVLWWADRPTGSQKLEGTVQARPGTFEAGAASGKEVTRRAEDNREKEYHSCAPFNSQLLPVCTLHIEGLSAAEPCCPGFHASPCILCSRLHFFLILALALDALCASSSMQPAVADLSEAAKLSPNDDTLAGVLRWPALLLPHSPSCLMLVPYLASRSGPVLLCLVLVPPPVKARILMPSSCSDRPTE